MKGKRSRMWTIAGVVLVVLVAIGPVTFFVMDRFRNPSVVQELIDEPQGERAARVMVLTLPSGRVIPVNYLREGERVYAGADGRWWKELEGEGFPVTLVIRGETLQGTARAVLDDAAYTKDVFSRLRPTALPGFGTLIEIELAPGA